MKITKALVKRFEEDQKEHSTAVAIHNVLWLVADGMLKDIGITKVHTSYKKGK
jgi:hypothetical protein